MNLTLPHITSAGCFYSHYKYPNLSHSPLRTVQVYEFEYFFKDGGASILNGAFYPIQKHTVLIARPGDIRQSILPFCCQYVHLSHVSGTLQHILDRLPSICTAGADGELLHLFKRISALFLSDIPADVLETASILFQLIRRLGSTEPPTSSLLSDAVRYIHAHYTEPITVPLVAHHCNVSPSYLYRLFAEKLGQSPHEVLSSRRISAAKSLLINTNLPLSRIAVDCGFGSQAYFSDCFRRRCGIPPAEFRKNAAYR